MLISGLAVMLSLALSRQPESGARGGVVAQVLLRLSIYFAAKQPLMMGFALSLSLFSFCEFV
jgi:hypothetical protein